MTGRLIVLGLVLVAAAAWALDPPRPAPAAPPAAPPAATQDPASEAPPQEAPAAPPPPAVAPEEEERLPPLPSGTRPTGPTPQRFDPTEKVRADFPVSFPIDI